MSHPLVTQLRFAHSESVRCLDGVSDELHLETHAVRQMLWRPALLQFVGDMAHAAYQRESIAG